MSVTQLSPLKTIADRGPKHAAAFCKLEGDIRDIKNAARIAFDSVHDIAEKLWYDGFDEDRAITQLRIMIECLSRECYRPH